MHHAFRHLLAAVIAAAVLWPTVCDAASPAKQLERGIELYYAGKLDEALAIFDHLGDAADTPREVRIRALEHQAFVLFLFKLHHEARRAWLRVLELDPSFELDPVEVSPELMGFFRDIEPETGTGLGGATAPATTDRGCGVALCLLPFGIGQFANDRPLKGALFAGAETLFLAANVGFYWAARAESDGGSRSSAETYFVVQRVSFGLFAAAAAWGILDAFLLP